MKELISGRLLRSVSLLVSTDNLGFFFFQQVIHPEYAVSLHTTVALLPERCRSYVTQ